MFYSVKGMQLDLEMELEGLKNGRRHISSSKNEVSRDLVVNVKSQMKQSLLVAARGCQAVSPPLTPFM
ncbi:hypothetical protein DAI22_12g102900 [Oryza sativa Japonica Group]|nr:hypothetical protein DAI22_12g102900 [Oryza sativa Japonica Group]